jgi:hypothetical protein
MHSIIRPVTDRLFLFGYSALAIPLWLFLFGYSSLNTVDERPDQRP